MHARACKQYTTPHPKGSPPAGGLRPSTGSPSAVSPNSTRNRGLAAAKRAAGVSDRSSWRASGSRNTRYIVGPRSRSTRCTAAISSLSVRVQSSRTSARSTSSATAKVRSRSEKRSPPPTASEPTAAPATTRRSFSARVKTLSRRASRCSTVNTTPRIVDRAASQLLESRSQSLTEFPEDSHQDHKRSRDSDFSLGSCARTPLCLSRAEPARAAGLSAFCTRLNSSARLRSAWSRALRASLHIDPRWSQPGSTRRPGCSISIGAIDEEIASGKPHWPSRRGRTLFPCRVSSGDGGLDDQFFHQDRLTASRWSLANVDRLDLHRLGRLPAFEQVAAQLVDLDSDGVAVGDRVRTIRTPPPIREVTAGAGRDCAQKVDLSEELEEVAFPRGARFHEVDLVFGVKAGDLEDVQHVMHVELGQVVWRDRARQVVMARDVVVTVVEKLVKVWIASTPEQVVAASSVRRGRGRQRVVGDRDHGTQVRQARPQPVERRDVGALQLACPGGPEPFARVVHVPQVEVADLRSFHGDDAHDAARLDRPCISAADRDDVLVHAPPAPGGPRDAFVKAAVDIKTSRHVRVVVEVHRASL